MANWTAPPPLVSGLGDWTSGPGPLYVRLARALRARIERGDVPAGARVAPERVLAEALGVSRTTVVLAYGRLRAGGLLDSRQGSGTFVAQPPRPAARPREDPSHSFLVDTVTRAAAEEPGDTVSFMGACLPAPDGALEGIWDEVRSDVAELTAGAGYSPQGMPALRRAIAAWYDGRGLPTTPDEVLITNGAQQAIDLAVRLLVAAGEAVVIEDPTYIGAIDAFTVARARRLPLVVGPTGADVEALGRLVSETAPALTYLVPTFHNPTGTVLPESARREVARLAEPRRTTILEDESLVDLSLGGEVPPPIAAFAPGAPVLTVGSLSKLFWGGLRVGWVRGPQPLVARLTHLKVTADLSGPAVSQAIAARLLPHREEVTRKRRRLSSERLQHLSGLLRERLPEWTFERPEGGLTLWVRLPSPAAEELARVALRHGVSIVPGPVHSPSGGCRDHVRLPFVMDAEPMTEGVARLARAWAVCGRPDRDRRLGVIV